MATRFAGIARRTAYDRRERDQDFAGAWDVAAEAGQRALIRERTRRTSGAPDQLAARLRAVRFGLDRRVFELEHSPALLKLRRVQEFATALRDAGSEINAVERLLDLQARDARRAWVAAWRESHPEAA